MKELIEELVVEDLLFLGLGQRDAQRGFHGLAVAVADQRQDLRRIDRLGGRDVGAG
jgi:hypothetical protein